MGAAGIRARQEVRESLETVIALPKPANRQMPSRSLRVLCAVRERLRGMGGQQATVEEKIAESIIRTCQ